MTGVALGLLLAGCSPDDGGTSPAPEPTPSATAAPEPSPAAPLPTPDEHTAVGELAEGFPADLLPLPAGAEVLTSTWAPLGEPGAGQPYGLSLNLRTTMPVPEVAEVFRASLTAAGFAETAGTPTDGLAVQSTYSRTSGDELVTVGVLDRDGTRTVTVGGQVRASG